VKRVWIGIGLAGCFDHGPVELADASVSFDAADHDAGLLPSPLVDVLFVSEIFVGPEPGCATPPDPCTSDATLEIANTGDADVALGLSNLCTKPAYWTIGEGIVIPAGGFLVVHWAEGTNTEGEVWSAGRTPDDIGFVLDLFVEGGEIALYDTNNAFSLPEAKAHMVDYVRWNLGSFDESRQDEAVAAGLWIQDETVDAPTWDETTSLVRTDPAHTAASWTVAPPSIGAAN
jgi:hypothetical protein